MSYACPHFVSACPGAWMPKTLNSIKHSVILIAANEAALRVERIFIKA